MKAKKEPSLGVDVDTVIDILQPEEYAARLLFLIKELTNRDSTFRPWHDGFQQNSRWHVIGYKGDLLPGKLKQLDLAFSEAWSWLEVQGLLVPDRDKAAFPSPETGNRQLSRRAHQFVDLVDVSRYAAARRLPRDSLHPAIADTVWSAFIRGEYDVAVFQAMKAVEVSVRDVAGLANTDIGTRLMRKAFDPKSGKLSDMATEEGEREAMSALFAGAIGSYKNPQSHRSVKVDEPTEAIEIVMLANHLLRIVDRRRAACNAGAEASTGASA